MKFIVYFSLHEGWLIEEQNVAAMKWKVLMKEEHVMWIKGMIGFQSPARLS